MKRSLIAIMAVLLTLVAPVSCSAYLDDEDYYFLSYERVSKRSKNSYYFDSVERVLFTFVPRSIKATTKGDKVQVKADISTAAQRIVVQYSKDYYFKKNVVTKTYKNEAYAGIVLATFHVHVESGAGKSSAFSTRIVSQNGKNLSYRRLNSSTELYMTDSIYDVAREKVSYAKTFTIPDLKNSKSYYMRMRAQYEESGKKYYSNWVDFEVK